VVDVVFGDIWEFIILAELHALASRLQDVSVIAQLHGLRQVGVDFAGFGVAGRTFDAGLVVGVEAIPVRAYLTPRSTIRKPSRAFVAVWVDLGAVVAFSGRLKGGTHVADCTAVAVGGHFVAAVFEGVMNANIIDVIAADIFCDASSVQSWVSESAPASHALSEVVFRAQVAIFVLALCDHLDVALL